VARFYGWTDETILDMPAERFEMYRKAIEPIKSIESLEGLTVAIHPHRTLKSQNEVIKKIKKPLSQFQKEKSLGDIDEIMRGL
jgi:hypothetical protein